jgi:hypothetical protein
LNKNNETAGDSPKKAVARSMTESIEGNA